MKGEGGRRKGARLRSFLLISLLFLSVPPVFAAITATQHSDAVPSEIHGSIAPALKPGGVRVSVDAVTLDFWWSAGVPITGDGAPAWGTVAEGAIVGAVRIAGAFRDIRGRVIKPGVYTLRYGVQPDDGDHLGASPHRQFLLLSPAAEDRNPEPQGHDGTIELSKAAIGGSHPAVWSIDPPAATQPLLSVHKTGLEHQAVIVEVPASRGGKPAGTLRFGIVLVGKIEA